MTPCNNLDVTPASFAQARDQFGDQGLVSGSQAGGADGVDPLFERER
jgi:hypothetical protein